MVGNPPCNARDAGLISGPGRFHILQLSLHVTGETRCNQIIFFFFSLKNNNTSSALCQLLK